jgi:hypothetical protein
MLARLRKRAGSTLTPLVGLVAMATVVVLAAPAGAHTPSGLEKAAPSARTAMAEQLRDHPGGTVISDNQISYAGGNVIETFPTGPVSPQATPNCPGGWLCLYESDNYQDRRWQFHDEGYTQNLAPYGATPFFSFYNNRGHRWFLHRGANGSGAETCYQAQARVSAMDVDWAYSKSIYLGTTNNRCGT